MNNILPFQKSCSNKPHPVELEPVTSEFFDNREEWLDAEGAAHYLKIPLGSVRNMTSDGKIPHYKLGRRVRYRVEDLRTLLLQNRRGEIKHGN